jgi:hypothetical protein
MIFDILFPKFEFNVSNMIARFEFKGIESSIYLECENLTVSNFHKFTNLHC